MLTRDIALALRQKPLSGHNEFSVSRVAFTRGILVAGMALAMLQADPAGALSLGDLKVQSALGQPFSGSTTARIGNGESLAPTEELPDLPGASEEETMNDLQSLSTEAENGTINDRMSETLTQALGLLSQDYEDEMTASQILEAEEVEEAFAERTANKN
ncbi:MAG: hypothetical protein CL799_04050 [Chromatiales bacterium]|nr:hypothetical protein [Chromatiales bacterium]MDP6149721.1 hypothetical protein [Gammaproteobacteria bacterium]MDP7093715.1 hypothetical protein [Gammaproteobacteria bacterium]HJP04406.1 hypothetical protein [Gammaproteobacteria bacterium]